MKNLILILGFAFIFTGCGTTQSDREWFQVMDNYKQECKDWYQRVGKKKFERKPGEETWSVQDVAVARCQEDPSICEPPRKPSRLKYFEHYWGKEETQDYCGSFAKDFRDDRFE